MYEPTLVSRFLKEIPPEVFDGPAPRPVLGTRVPSAPLTAPRAPAWMTGGAARPGGSSMHPTPAATPYRRSVPDDDEDDPGARRPMSPPASRPGLSASRPADRRTMVPDSLAELFPGRDVFHPLLGIGTIQKREGIPSNPRLTIQFKDHGPRTIFASAANLEILLS